MSAGTSMTLQQETRKTELLREQHLKTFLQTGPARSAVSARTSSLRRSDFMKKRLAAGQSLFVMSGMSPADANMQNGRIFIPRP